MSTHAANDWMASNWGAPLDGPCCAVAVASDGATHAACRTVADALFEVRADLARVTRERDEARKDTLFWVNRTADEMRDRRKAEDERDAYRDVVDKARAWAAQFKPATGWSLHPDYYSSEEITLVIAVDALPPTTGEAT